MLKTLYTGALALTLSLPLAACGKKNSARHLVDHNFNQNQPVSVETNKEFSLTGDLVKDGDSYTLQRNFTFSLSEQQKLKLNENALISKCEGDAEPTSFYMLAKSDDTVKLANSDVEGYTLVQDSFPGTIPAGAYNLTIVFVSAAPCSIEGSSLVLEVLPADVPTPTPSTFDSRLVGTWKTEVAGSYSETITYTAAGMANDKVILQGATYYDFELKLENNTQANPAQLVETLTTIRFKDPEVEAVVGDKVFCIYELTTASKLKMECDDTLPTTFSADAQIFTKQ